MSEPYHDPIIDDLALAQSQLAAKDREIATFEAEKKRVLATLFGAPLRFSSRSRLRGYRILKLSGILPDDHARGTRRAGWATR